MKNYTTLSPPPPEDNVLPATIYTLLHYCRNSDLYARLSQRINPQSVAGRKFLFPFALKLNLFPIFLFF